MHANTYIQLPEYCYELLLKKNHTAKKLPSFVDILLYRVRKNQTDRELLQCSLAKLKTVAQNSQLTNSRTQRNRSLQYTRLIETCCTEHLL